MDGLFQFVKDLLFMVSINSAEDIPKLLAYLVPLVLAWTIYRRIKRSASVRSQEKLKAAAESGAEPATLHPLIDYNKCLGCGTCVSACPEGDVLGIINDKAFLVNPSHCIGHGACKAACPQDAIQLVFGTSRRGVDIPIVRPNFETNIPGIFIAGELGGMGLIRNAIEQGRQAMENIVKKPGIGQGNALDVVIVGAGPAGFAASLCALKHRMRFITIEQDTLGGAVAHFPRGKIVMTAPADLPLYGRLNFRETTKESIMALWQDVAKKTGVRISYQERMENITPTPDGFILETSRHRYLTKNVLLAIGRRGTPRKLEVPGEDQPKVVYSLIDPEQYRNQRVLVVGGGNSALEAATAVAEEPGTMVTLSYRGKTYSRAADKNVQKVSELEASGRLKVMLESDVKEIKPDSVDLSYRGKLLRLKNDAVIVCAGGVLPTPLLKKVGIEVETKFGTA
jgi:thioredoxin reductase/Pyruvate/2-oxoacid:ferredoxin oxidoreductase delta subunit